MRNLVGFNQTPTNTETGETGEKRIEGLGSVWLLTIISAGERKTNRPILLGGGGGKLEKKIRGRGGRTDKVGKRANKEKSSFFLNEFKHTKQWLIGSQFSHSVLSSPPTFPDPGPSPPYLVLFCIVLVSKNCVEVLRVALELWTGSKRRAGGREGV